MNLDGVGWAATEIVLFMVVATLIGFAIGWVFGRWLQSRTIAEGFEAQLATQDELARKAEHRLTESNKGMDKLQLELKGGHERIGELEAQLESLQEELDAAPSETDEAELAQLKTDIEACGAERDKMSARVSELESEVAGHETTVARVADLEGQLATEADAASRIADLEGQVADRDALAARVGDLEGQVADRDALASRMSELKAEVADRDGLSARIAELEGDVSDRDALAARVGELEGQLGDRDALATRVAELESQLAEKDTKPVVTEAVAPVAAVDSDGPSKEEGLERIAEIATRTAGGGPAADDDLKKVHGIGPKLERTLKGLGITSFRQIANFESDDIAYVTAALDGFKGRIERDDWMTSAAEQHLSKYNEPA